LRALLSGYVAGKATGGPECEAFERELEAYYAVPHARVLNSATSALHAALVALGIGPGDEVLVPAYSMSASAAAIIHAGARPVFCDIGDDYCLDWADALKRATSRVKAAILVHLFGHHADAPAVTDGLAIVHDASQSPSLRPRMRPGVREIWCYSLNQWKLVTCGEGGYTLTFQQDLADRVHLVRNHGECVSDVLGWNYRMTEPTAKIARAEFSDIDRRLADRKTWANHMRQLHDLPEDRGNHDWFRYPVRCRADTRVALAARIGGKIGYCTPIPDMSYFSALGYTTPPNVTRIESELVTLDPLCA